MLKNNEQPKTISEIEGRISILVGQKVDSMGRAGSMMWIGFGDRVTITSFLKKEKREVSRYALHIACAWRLMKEKRIHVASADVYYPPGGEYISDFDWTPQGSNQFDKKTDEFMNMFNNMDVMVEEIYADLCGGFKLLLSHGFCLEVFPNDSLLEEYWRFIDFSNEESHHFVIFDEDTEYLLK